MSHRPIIILFFSDSHLGFDLPLHPRIQVRRRGHDFFRNYQHILDTALKIKAKIYFFMRPKGWFYGGKNINDRCNHNAKNS